MSNPIIKPEDRAVLIGLKYAIMGIVALVVVFVGSCQMTNYQIRKMVESGTHPRVAECAVSSSGCYLSETATLELEKLDE